MKVLMLGGTTFFGRLTVERLLARGDEVTVFTRGTRPLNFSRPVDYVAGDRQARDEFREKLSGREFDAVVDNIAFTGEDVERAIEVFAGSIGHYVLTSSMAVNTPQDSWDRYELVGVAEADLEATGGGGYALGKRQGELVLRERGAELKAPATVIRPTVVQGPDDPTGRTWFWLQRIKDGGPVLLPETAPDAVFNHVFSGDVAALIAAATGNPAAYGRTYNAAGGAALTLADYVRALAALAGREAKLVRAPLAAIRAQPGLEKFGAPFAGQRTILDTGPARADLGWRPTPLRRWLKQTVDWLLDEYRGGDSKGYELREAELAAASTLGKGA